MIRISDYIKEENIIFYDDIVLKKEAIDDLIDLISKSDKINNEEKLYNDIWERESIMSTGIGVGIGIPHIHVDYVDDIEMAIGISKEGIDYKSLDDEPVNFVVMIVANKDSHEKYIKLLAKVALILKSPKKRKKILKSKNREEVYKILTNL
ncbi:MAG: PTS sugar transporter subunit IIA [Candidatus Mcinerneyibacterium aminivorans]|uniref:PTS sugar transporter subunit IIA n=1 Tax=Candidatus Mcinerneyibacterium aminivorans TaxID=2703815 RepID=A0A5D0MFS6_9BACT|nr:MAG: PTS sugar transporter subunit IIA [Candidatus Mcinerneyibacterium aminivorans]